MKSSAVNSVYRWGDWAPTKDRWRILNLNMTLFHLQQTKKCGEFVSSVVLLLLKNVTDNSFARYETQKYSSSSVVRQVLSSTLQVPRCVLAPPILSCKHHVTWGLGTLIYPTMHFPSASDSNSKEYVLQTSTDRNPSTMYSRNSPEVCVYILGIKKWLCISKIPTLLHGLFKAPCRPKGKTEGSLGTYHVKYKTMSCILYIYSYLLEL